MISEILAVGILFAFLSAANYYEWFCRGNRNHFHKNFIEMVCCNPVGIMLIFCGGIKIPAGICIQGIQIAAGYLILRHIERTQIPEAREKRWMKYYILVTDALFGILFSVFASGQDIEKETPAATLLILASFFLVLLCISFFAGRAEEDKPGAIETESGSEYEKNICGHHCFSKTDFLIMTGITIGYAILVLWHLGSMAAPKTQLMLQEFRYDGIGDRTVPPENSTIVLDLGKETKLKNLILYLGDRDHCVIEIDSYDQKGKAWISDEKAIELNNNFDWNQIPLDTTTRYLRIIERQKNAVFLEAVLFDSKGKRLLPENAAAYKTLFDEQDLFPIYNTCYYHTVFDEAYYASSAHQFLSGSNMNEQTHPPFGKAIMSIGMLLFGASPFGWRFSVAALGIAMVPLMYLFLLDLTGRSKYALAGSLLFCSDFIHFSLSRIGTLDNVAAFFILAETAVTYHLLKRLEKNTSETDSSGGLLIHKTDLPWIFLCAVISGAAVAVKWTGAFAVLGAAVIWIFFMMTKGKEKKMRLRYLLYGVFTFAIIPCVIYILSFEPFYHVMGYSDVLTGAVRKSVDMLKFHENAVFSHPYASPWYTWALDWKPLVDTINTMDQRHVSTVATFGNPLLWWSSIPVFFWTAYRAMYRKDRHSIFLVTMYLALLLPWVVIRRTVFIYQYYGCALLNIGMLTEALQHMEKKFPQAIWIFTAGCLLMFLIFYPILSGMRADGTMISLWLEWMQNWKFA